MMKRHPVSERKRYERSGVVEERGLQTPSFDCVLFCEKPSAQELSYG